MSHIAGSWQLHIRKQPGTTVVTVLPADATAAPSKSALPPPPLAVCVSLEALQLDVCDDERRRLSGGRPDARGAAGAEHGSPRKGGEGMWTAPAELGSRLFCISLDRVGVQLVHRQVLGGYISGFRAPLSLCLRPCCTG